ncbi:hypothetical protein, partial [Bartonella sp. AC134YNZD]|uniref:hypothetical protein n=1 Tax=Bartonella sp. AC134YNZD TaxID=3243446 RepID=UPI0035CEA23E
SNEKNYSQNSFFSKLFFFSNQNSFEKKLFSKNIKLFLKNIKLFSKTILESKIVFKNLFQKKLYQCFGTKTVFEKVCLKTIFENLFSKNCFLKCFQFKKLISKLF